MRELVDSTRIEKFMRELGRAAQVECRVYLTGGATAVLHGWRETTIDVDIKLMPDRDEILREIPRLKALKMVTEWATDHQDELRENWNLSRDHKPPRPIDPLR
jgi:hypothetical protein